MSIQFNGAGSLKKTLSVLTSMATVLSLSGFAALAPLATSAAAPSDYGLKEGDTISAAGSDDPDVYIVNQQGYKRLFLNPVIFSFYGHLGGFANVKNVTPAVRDAFPTSGLFRNCETNDPKVYGVEVNGEDTAVLHWVNTSGAQAVADDPNFFNKVFCINNNEFNWYAKGSDYTSVNQVPNYSRQPGQTTTPTGPLSAGLAADNPASGTLVAEQALADLAHFSVMGSGTVTSVQLKRLGVSGDSTLSNVFLFVNGVRVSDSGNVSSGMITFNNAAGLFTAPATLVVKSDILTGTSGQTVGVQLTGLNGQSVSASGNLFTIASTPSLASVTIGSVTGPGDFDPQADVNVMSANSFQVSNEDVYLRRLTVREIGSVNNTDVRNLRLLVDGVQVGSAAGLDADGYATFVTNQRVTTGSHTLKVVADVVGGSGRTMQFSIRGAYDIEVVDEAYNVGVKATDTFPVTVSVASTVGQASVTVVKATNSPSGDVVDEALDVPLARFTLTGYGEATKIDSLGFRASVSDAGISGLSGGRVLIDGTQYGSTTNFSTTATTSFSVNYTLQPGTSVTVEVRADMKEQSNGTDVSSGDKISVLFDGGDLNNGQGVSSANLVDIPTSTLEGNNLSVVQGSLTLSKATNYPDQNITPPQSAYKIGQWTVTGSSAESININTFTVTIAAEDGTTFDNTDLTNLYLKYGTTQTSPKGTVNASNDFSVTRTLAANEVMTVELYATIGSNITTGDSMRASLAIGATTASGANANQGATPGQEIDTQAGIFSTSVDTGSPKLVLSASAVSAGTWRFRGENDNFSLTELRFKVASASNEQLAVASVDLK
ncbi:MAG TPA: hypothetical protein VG941_03245, partial [Candidatus Paceibacterota bacterium]|nr:hypothetical protein [Candidatus Paceibacterota bacterium]